MRPGERLKQAREKLRLTQTEMGKPLGFTYSKIRDLESGKQKITLEIAKKLEDNFSISSSWILEGDGSMMVRLEVAHIKPISQGGVGADNILLLTPEEHAALDALDRENLALLLKLNQRKQRELKAELYRLLAEQEREALKRGE